MSQLRELVSMVNTAALVESLIEMGINPDIMTTLVAGRYNELRGIVYKQLGSLLAADGLQQQIPTELNPLVQFYAALSTKGGLNGGMEIESVTDSGYSLVATNCMFKASRDILLERHPDSPPPCFIAALFAGIVSGAIGKTCTPESVEIMGDKCRFITSIE